MVSQNVTIKTLNKTGRDLHNLKQNNKIVTDTIEQTNIYNGQFQSVFNSKSPLSLVRLAQMSLQDTLDKGSIDPSTYVIFSWAQIGRCAIFGREIGVPFRSKKYSILVSKIVICSTVDHCKMFYLPTYG